MLDRIRGFLALGVVPNTKLYLTGVPLVLLGSVGSFVSPGETALALGYLLANLISLVFVGVIYALGYWLTGRIGQRFVLSTLLIFGLALGLAKQLSTAWVLVQFGLETNFGEAVLLRALTPLLGLWYVLALAAISASQARFAALREQLIAERVRVLAGERREHAELIEFATEAREMIAQSQGTANELAALIRSIVAERLRPLSHKLWEREQLRTPGFSTRELAIRALQYRPYRILRILVIYSLGSVAPMILLAGSRWFVALVALSAAVSAVMFLANFIRRRSDWAKRQYLLALVLSSTVGTSVGFLTLGLLGYQASVVLWLASTWWLGTLIVVVGMFVVALEDHAKQRELLAELAESEITSAARQSVSAFENRELANLLHSKTQNRMLAGALRLEAGADLATELAQLLELLAALPEQRGEQLSADGLVERWRGIVDVSFDLDREPTQTQLRACEEAIANAFRHGQATRVEVLLRGDKLLVTDNGYGPRSGAAGLGSALYTAAGDWQLRARAEGGAALELTLSEV